MAYSARILCDSINRKVQRLTTMEVTFPRFILAEFNTHRLFSRNSASSRAIPFAKQVARVMADPFIPIYWGKNQSGMQADQEIDEELQQVGREKWLRARDYAVEQATILSDIGTHKQIVNRLLEPFMWHTVIVTATEWKNFFALRIHPDAQPEIQHIAKMMRQRLEQSTPKLVEVGNWHLPLILPDEYNGVFEYSLKAREVSAARCARVSYLTHDGQRSIDADLELYHRLVSSGHMSPLEHVATPLLYKPGYSNFRGWRQLRKTIPGEDVYSYKD